MSSWLADANEELARNREIVTTILCLETWEGRREYPVEIVGETRTRYRVKILAPDGVCLPKYTFAPYGKVVLVPKASVRKMAKREGAE